MAMPGPQIGGISLFAHVLIIVVSTLKKLLIKIKINLSIFYRKIFHPFPQDAK